MRTSGNSNNSTMKFGMVSPGTKAAFVGIAIAVGALFPSAVSAGSGAEADVSDPTGFWQTSGGERMIEVAPCSGKTAKLCGTILWAEDAAEVDAVVLKRFRLIGDMWAGGQVYTPGKRRGQNGRLTLLDDGKLEVSECKRGLCTNEVWVRVAETEVASRRAKLMAQN
ncbi:DUF2147 domain-containing protein [Kordiimonas aestuarii]|uniref:DUF2147 domain-containing protein n=1 Tax=Kordiimonas aestuarii TaxID=1005925 RepID=UPI0021D2748C|nr:DUF2147 domain-containing protein [Kordiimonas aestuarii]